MPGAVKITKDHISVWHLIWNVIDLYTGINDLIPRDGFTPITCWLSGDVMRNYIETCDRACNALTHRTTEYITTHYVAMAVCTSVSLVARQVYSALQS